MEGNGEFLRAARGHFINTSSVGSVSHTAPSSVKKERIPKDFSDSWSFFFRNTKPPLHVDLYSAHRTGYFSCQTCCEHRLCGSL